MEDWYWIGVVCGLGVAIGLAVTGALAKSRTGFVLATVLAVWGGVGAGFLIDDLGEAVGGAVGGLAGSLGGAQLLSGTLRRGGTRVGTAVFLALGALGVAAIAFVPAAGYLEAVAVPALAARLRRLGGKRYAGLRTLAD